MLSKSTLIALGCTILILAATGCNSIFREGIGQTAQAVGAKAAQLLGQDDNLKWTSHSMAEGVTISFPESFTKEQDFTTNIPEVTFEYAWGSESKEIMVMSVGMNVHPQNVGQITAKNVLVASQESARKATPGYLAGIPEKTGDNEYRAKNSVSKTESVRVYGCRLFMFTQAIVDQDKGYINQVLICEDQFPTYGEDFASQVFDGFAYPGKTR